MSEPPEPEKKRIRNSTAEFLIFTSESSDANIEARYEDETIWLTQKLMAVLFDVSIPTINEHLKNIFESDEIDADSVIREFRITASDGKSYNTKHYNLDAIISVGYRVNSVRATQFRQWAKRLDKFIDFNDREILQNPGLISAQIAQDHAEIEFEKYRVAQDRLFKSDFDKLPEVKKESSDGHE